MRSQSMSDSRSGWLMAFIAGALIAQYVASRATRDALFLSIFDPTLLPRVMLVTAIVSFVAVSGAGRLMAKWGPSRLVSFLCMVNGVFFLSEWWVFRGQRDVTSAVTYLHVTVVGSILVSAFWSIVNERFDPHSAKRWVSRIGAGATLGGVVGGVLSQRASVYFETHTMLAFLAATSFLLAAITNMLGTEKTPKTDKAKGGVAAISQSPYLLRIAMLVILLSAIGALLDYVLKASAAAKYTNGAELLSFFSAFYTIVGVAMFFVQSVAAGPLLRWLGLVKTISLLPLIVLFMASIAAVWTRFSTVVLAQAAKTIFSHSLFRSGYELLYTPLSRNDKRSAKGVIDVGCDQIGDGLGSLLIIAMLWITVAQLNIVLLIAVIVLCVVALGIAWSLRSMYVDQLANGLRTGSLQLDETQIQDATTRLTFTQTVEGMSRGDILAGIQELRQAQQDNGISSEQKTHTAEQFKALLSEDSSVVREALDDPGLDPSLAPFVVQLLSDNGVRINASKALIRMLPNATGVLVDALVSKHNNDTIRRRVARLLHHSIDPRAAHGLIRGLNDERFEIRFRCSEALAKWTRRQPEQTIPHEALWEAVNREVKVDKKLRLSQQSLDEVSDEPQTQISTLLSSRADKNLEHIFFLLSILLDRDAVIVALSALDQSDKNLRGTALEYLHHVLPPHIRKALWPRLIGEGTPAQELKDSNADPKELLKSMQSLILEREEFEKLKGE